MRIAALLFVVALPVTALAAGPMANNGELQTQGVQPDSGTPGVTVEEVNALESAFEGRVHDILNGILKPDQFAVYVQVNMKSDPKVIKAYYDERAMQTMPGLPIPDPDLANPANDKLYSLVQSKKVIVVLDKSVTGNQELIAKEVLTAKLGINPQAGDSIEFRRAEVPNAEDRAIAAATTAQPANWMKYSLIGLAILLVAGIAFLLWQLSLMKERLESRAKLSADLDLAKAMDSQNESETSEKLASKNSSASPAQPEDTEADPPTEEASPEEAEAGEKVAKSDSEALPTLAPEELKEKILTLAVSHPNASSRVVRKLLSTHAGMKKMAVVCDMIGFEYAKQLFDSVSTGKWRALGQVLRNNLAEIKAQQIAPTMTEVYTDLLAESMGTDTNAPSEGPFDFLHKLSEPELRKIFANEDPTHIAFVAAFWEPEEMSSILQQLPEAKRKETVLQIARLQGLPNEVVQNAALHFAERLKDIRTRNETEVNGTELLARVLGTVDGSVEEELLEFIEKQDPATRERLRGHYFSFDSLNLIPADILKNVLEQIDQENLVKALTGAKPGLVSDVLEVLPPKKRAIIEDDLALASQNGGSKSDSASARKLLVSEVRQALRDRGVSISELLATARAHDSGQEDGTQELAVDPTAMDSTTPDPSTSERPPFEPRTASEAPPFDPATAEVAEAPESPDSLAAVTRPNGEPSTPTEAATTSDNTGDEATEPGDGGQEAA